MSAKRIKSKEKIGKKMARPRYWIAVGALAAYTTSGANTVVFGQDLPGARGLGSDRTQALPVRRYQIQSGALRLVLESFRNTSGASVGVSDAALLDIQSPGVSGVYTEEEALRKLLADTGLSFSVLGKQEFRVELKRTATSIEVHETAPVISSSLPKYQGPLVDTAQTVGVVTQRTMEEQGVTTLRDTLRNVAGISLAAGEGGAQGDNLTIRGFTARNDLFIDGMRDFGSYYRDSFNTEEVEVLQGPSSVTFGRGSTGGVVNQASKTPDLNHQLSADLQFGTDATRRATLDLDTLTPRLGPGAAFRLTVMGDIGGVAGQDVAKNRRDGFAPSLALGLGTSTRLTSSYFHQNEDDIPDYGIPWLFNGPAPVPRTNYYGLQEGNYLRTYDDIGTVKLEHDVNGNITLREQARYANYVRDVLITEPQLSGVPFTTPLRDLHVTRHEIGVNSTETFLDDQLDLIAHFKTGRLRHSLVAGIEGGRESSDPTRPNYTAPMTSLLDPDPSRSLNPNVTIASRVSDIGLSAGAYALDTASLGKWDLTGGVRFDRFDNTYDQTIAPATHLTRADQKPTWRIAAVYKPIAEGSLYFDAGTSFNPSAESLSLNGGTANLPPETNHAYDFGTKWDLMRSHLHVNGSWFRTVKENARESSPTNSLLYVLAGGQRVSGVETDVRGDITSLWDLLVSYAYLDSRVVNSQFYPGAVGYPLANVPKDSFAFWSTHRLPHHFDFGVGTNYESSRSASSTVPIDLTTGLLKQVPGYWLFNAMVGHPMGEHIDLQLNIYNLANRYYYDELHPGHIVLGAGRSALLDLKFKF